MSYKTFKELGVDQAADENGQNVEDKVDKIINTVEKIALQAEENKDVENAADDSDDTLERFERLDRFEELQDAVADLSKRVDILEERITVSATVHTLIEQYVTPYKHVWVGVVVGLAFRFL
jgi:Cdc6-like AAA superfamily ATPase